jgi:D-alanine-D-alanine ligase
MYTKDDLKNKRIAVLMGGLSAEREISLKSGDAVLKGLLRKNYNAVPIDVDRNLPTVLISEGIDIAFIALHGRFGEDGTLQGLLEMMAMPYTGSGVLGSALAMDKCLCKVFLESLKVPTPAYHVCASPDDCSFPVPFVAKPAREGSTVGISIVRKEEEAAQAVRKAFDCDTKVILESFVHGKEITVSVVNGKALPIVEVRPKSGFYDYTSKYTKGMTDYIVPAQIDKSIEETASEYALTVYRHFELSGCARIDMIVDEKCTPQVIDINTSPGMTETSLVPMAWEVCGSTFDDLVEEILLDARIKA